MGNPTSIFIHSAIWAGPDLSRTWLSWCGKPSLLGAQWICGSRSNGHSDGLDMTIGGESYHSWMGNILVGFGSDSDLSFWILLWTFWTLALNVLVDLWRSCRNAGKQFQTGVWGENNHCTWLLPRQPPSPLMGCYRRHNVLWEKIGGHGSWIEQPGRGHRILKSCCISSRINNSKWSPWFILNNQPVQKQVKHQYFFCWLMLISWHSDWRFSV